MNALSSRNHAHYEDMSPSLLAEQPPTPSGPKKRQPDWGRIYTHLEGRLQGMRTWRYSWWLYWQQLAQYILPRRYKWLVTANSMWRGSPLNNSIIDSTATLAMQTCAAGMWTGLTSPSRPWFKMGIALPSGQNALDRDAEIWLTDTTQRISAVMHQSNFYTVMAQAFQDVTVFGTAPALIYEDAEDVIRLYLPCAGEYFLAVGGRLSVDAFDREFTFTIAQCVDFFGLENCPPEIQQSWHEGGGEWQREVIVAHAIEPNSPLQAYGKFKGQVNVVSPEFVYRELYWMRGQDTGGELSRRGFHERPFMVARWSTVSNDPYGRSPAMDALGDVKQLQLETVRKAEYLEKLIRPPMVADVEMKNEPSSIRPGEITYADLSTGKKGFHPAFEVNPQALGPLTEDIAQVQARIKEAFFVNLFMAISQMEGVQPRNELEITKRDLERLQALGPFITLFENEFATPAIARIVAIMQRRGLLKPMPPSLKKIPLQIEYQSILRLAQMSAEAVQMKDFMQTAGELSAAAKAAQVPDPIRIINLDDAMRRYASIVRFDPDLLFTKDEVQQHDAERLKEVQAQQVAATTPAMVGAAKTLSDTPLGGNSALSALLGGQGRPGGGA